VWILDPQPEISVVAADVSRLHNPSSQSGLTSAATVIKIPPRDPPIRFRKSVSDCWIGLELIEGKNRQVRRMTAAVGHPTLRLIRMRIGQFKLGDLPAGQWRILTAEERALVVKSGTGLRPVC
jgi:pseudouridine synthase